MIALNVVGLVGFVIVIVMNKGIDGLGFARADMAVENTTIVEDENFGHRAAWIPPPPTDCWGGDEFMTDLSKGVVKHVFNLYGGTEYSKRRDAIWKNFANTGKEPIFVAFTDVAALNDPEQYKWKYSNGLHFHCVHYIHDYVQILTAHK